MHSFPVNWNSVSTKANFRCDMYPGSIGFPTRRKKERGNYIASNNSTMWFKCPEKCRRQPEWTYCWARIWISLCTFFFKSRRLVCNQCKTEDWKPHWKIIFQKHQDSILANIIIWNNHKVVCMLFFFAEVKTLCYDWDQFARESKAAWQLCSWRSSWHCFTSCYGQIMMSIQQKEIKFSRV